MPALNPYDKPSPGTCIFPLAGDHFPSDCSMLCILNFQIYRFSLSFHSLLKPRWCIGRFSLIVS
jgi:hypothetical protein